MVLFSRCHGFNTLWRYISIIFFMAQYGASRVRQPDEGVPVATAERLDFRPASLCAGVFRGETPAHKGFTTRQGGVKEKKAAVSG
jgi:hypothetical protein